jgi:hypothetical protein
MLSMAKFRSVKFHSNETLFFLTITIYPTTVLSTRLPNHLSLQGKVKVVGEHQTLAFILYFMSTQGKGIRHMWSSVDSFEEVQNCIQI